MINHVANPAKIIVLEMTPSKSLAISKKFEMVNYFYFFIPTIFLLMSFTDHETIWSVGGVDVRGSLFVLCIVLYFPMMVFAFCCFFRAVVFIFRAKRIQSGIYFLVAAAVGVVALYSFNHWLFGEIY